MKVGNDVKEQKERKQIRLGRICMAGWFLIYVMIGVSLYYRRFGGSWALFFWDVWSLFEGCPDFLRHGKKLMLAWFLCGILIFCMMKAVHRRMKSHGPEFVFMGICLAAAFIYALADGFGADRYSLETQGEWKESSRIAHSLGGIDGHKGTGSREALELNYENGMRVFEADFLFTEDGDLVLSHDWNRSREMQQELPAEETPTLEVFQNSLIYGEYTPLSFRDLCVLMQEYPDIYVVTDSKYTDPEKIETEFDLIMDIIGEFEDSESILDRLIIQVYSPEMYIQLQKNYPFREYLFTLYKIWDGETSRFIRYCRWCKANNISTITIKNKFATQEIMEIADRYGLDVFVHTINDEERAAELEMMGVAGIYTDFLLQG